MRLEDGKTLWVKQLTKGDAFNIGCVVEDKANCPKDAGPDFDIGAPPILRKLNDGKRILIVGQKSGVVYGLDPDDKGNKVWQTRIGKGSALGGVEFGAAADEDGLRSTFGFGSGSQLGGGVFALEIATGKKVWNAAPAVPTCIAKPGCSAAQPAPATLISGVVFSGSMDGHIRRAYDTATGAVVWDFDTTRIVSDGEWCGRTRRIAELMPERWSPEEWFT